MRARATVQHREAVHSTLCGHLPMKKRPRVLATCACIAILTPPVTSPHLNALSARSTEADSVGREQAGCVTARRHRNLTRVDQIAASHRVAWHSAFPTDRPCARRRVDGARQISIYWRVPPTYRRFPLCCTHCGKCGTCASPLESFLNTPARTPSQLITSHGMFIFVRAGKGPSWGAKNSFRRASWRRCRLPRRRDGRSTAAT